MKMTCEFRIVKVEQKDAVTEWIVEAQDAMSSAFSALLGGAVWKELGRFKTEAEAITELDAAVRKDEAIIERRTIVRHITADFDVKTVQAREGKAR